MGKGGIDIIPSEERSAPEAPYHLQGETETNPDRFDPVTAGATDSSGEKVKLLPRETGHDIGMGSPVPLSAEAVGVITRLRNMKVDKLILMGCSRSHYTGSRTKMRIGDAGATLFLKQRASSPRME